MTSGREDKKTKEKPKIEIFMIYIIYIYIYICIYSPTNQIFTIYLMTVDYDCDYITYTLTQANDHIESNYEAQEEARRPGTICCLLYHSKLKR